MKWQLLFTGTLLLLLVQVFPARAQAEARFEKATAAYNEGDYLKAISYYEDILAGKQHSAALYFNLGNAHYKLGHIAPSIYYYEKALLLDPDDPEIRNNLGFAQNMTLDAIQPLPKTDLRRLYDRLIYFLSLDTWAYAGVMFMFLFVTGYMLFASWRRPNQKLPWGVPPWLTCNMPPIRLTSPPSYSTRRWWPALSQTSSLRKLSDCMRGPGYSSRIPLTPGKKYCWQMGRRAGYPGIL